MTETGDNTLDGKPVQLIRLLDGTLIDPLTREPVNSSVKPPARASSQPEQDTPDDEGDNDDVQLVMRPAERRSLHDLKMPPGQQAMVNNVLVYTLYGLPTDEVGIQCNISMRDVEIIRQLDEYKEMEGHLINGLRDAYAASIQGMLADAAPKAAKKIISGLKSKSTDITHAAAKDILDRSGHRPADRVEHTHNIGNGGELVIRVLRERDRGSIPTLDLKPNA
jgi:hypothetical protein